MKILITGCAGYLGQVLYPFLKKKHEVKGMDCFLYNQSLAIKDEIMQGDITSVKDMYRMTKGMDVVIALAGIVGDPACGLNEEETRIINIESTKLLVDACEVNKVKQLIFASSCSVYGASPKVDRILTLESFEFICHQQSRIRKDYYGTLPDSATIDFTIRYFIWLVAPYAF